jgi:hypothetical protein
MNDQTQEKTKGELEECAKSYASLLAKALNDACEVMNEAREKHGLVLSFKIDDSTGKFAVAELSCVMTKSLKLV